MGFIPEGARWYLADIILELLIEGDPQNVVHINMHLIEAESSEQGYEKALALGRRSEHEYLNTDGKQVRVRFRGLRQLNVIHEELEDGAELTYAESVGVAEEQLRNWIPPKARLAVFAPIQGRSDGPNYMPESVMQMLEAHGVERGELECSARPEAEGP
jgi:Domain of unknown function (DUF4288)